MGPALVLACVALLAAAPGRAQELPGDDDRSLRTALGHTAEACRRRAAAHEVAGDPEGEARFSRLALFLDPEDAESRGRLARRGAPEQGPPPEMLVALGEVDGASRRALSLGWLGEPRQGMRLLESRRDPVALGVRAQLLVDLGDFAAARRVLEDLEGRSAVAPPGRALGAYLRATIAQWEGDSDAEGRLLEEARRLAPRDPELLGALAARELAAGNAAAGERWLRYEASLPAFSDPGRISTRATLLAALGRTEAAERELERLRREHLLSPQTLIVEAGLRLRQGRAEEAARALEQMVAQTRGSMVLVPAANLLASIGRQQLAHQAVARLEPAIARSPQVQQLLERLSSLPADGRMQQGRRGGIAWQAAAGAPVTAVDGALLVFQEARAYVDAAIGRAGPDPFPLTIVHTPGEAPWGYYDAVQRRIVCRGDYRGVARERRGDALLEHVARHEYAHLAFDSLLRREGEGIVPYPRWMMEGVADQLAGGVEYLAEFGYHLVGLDPEPMSEDALARVLAAPVLGMGRIHQDDQARAYAQSHAMVGALLKSLGEQSRWLRLAAFVRRLAEGRDLKLELKRQFATDVEGLAAAYTRRQRARRAAQGQ